MFEILAPKFKKSNKKQKNWLHSTQPPSEH